MDGKEIQELELSTLCPYIDDDCTKHNKQILVVFTFKQGLVTLLTRFAFVAFVLFALTVKGDAVCFFFFLPDE